MKHATDRDLALFAGRELSLWKRLRVQMHINGCERCRLEADAYRETQANLKAVASELPPQLDWERMEREMRANIRVGLAAAQCLPPREQGDRHIGWKPALAMACFSLLVAAGYWVSSPFSPLRRQPVAPPVAAETSGIRLRATRAGVEVQQNGRIMTLVNPEQNPDQGRSFTMTSGDSVRTRYVDSETGQVTINHVYME